MEIINNKETLTIKEVAERLGVCSATARKIMKGSGFPSFKIGSRIFVSEKDFNEWMTKIAGKEIKIDMEKIQKN